MRLSRPSPPCAPSNTFGFTLKKSSQCRTFTHPLLSLNGFQTRSFAAKKKKPEIDRSINDGVDYSESGVKIGTTEVNDENTHWFTNPRNYRSVREKVYKAKEKRLHNIQTKKAFSPLIEDKKSQLISRRVLRVSELVKKCVDDVITEQTFRSELGNAIFPQEMLGKGFSIVKLSLSKDLSYCKLYWEASTKENADLIAPYLKKSVLLNQFRHAVAQKMAHVKTAPTFSFERNDYTAADLANFETAMDQIEKQLEDREDPTKIRALQDDPEFQKIIAQLRSAPKVPFSETEQQVSNFLEDDLDDMERIIIGEAEEGDEEIEQDNEADAELATILSSFEHNMVSKPRAPVKPESPLPKELFPQEALPEDAFEKISARKVARAQAKAPVPNENITAKTTEKSQSKTKKQRDRT
jgi:hypothetical protein